MMQAIIGITALILLVIIIKDYLNAKTLREKQDELSEIGDKKSIMSVDEKIVSEEIGLKKRSDKLEKEKEKLNV